DNNTITLSADGEYLVRYTPKDALGNLGTAFTPIAVNIDKTLPSVPTTLTGGNATWDKLRTTATFVATGSTDANGGDATVTYEYLLTTNADAAATASPVVTAQGQTTAQVRAKDRAGNYSAYFAGTSPGNTILIDTVAPTVPTVSGGSTTWQNTAPRVITASGSSDAGPIGVFTSEGVTYTSETSVNGLDFSSSIASSATRSVSDEGTTVVRFKAIDLAGNESVFSSGTGSVDNQVMIDTVAPTAPVVTGGSAGWVAGPTQTITASTLGTDVAPGSGVLRTEFETTTDLSGAGVWSATTTGTSITYSTTGERAVRFRTVDNATNVSAWSPASPTASSTSRLDVTAPVVPVVSGGSDNFQNAPSVTVTAAATTDVGSGVAGYTHQTSTDGGTTWLPFPPAAGSSVVVSAEGTTLVRFFAIDQMGNVSAATATTPGSTVKIDRTAPTNPTATGGSYTWQKVASVDVSPAGSTDLNASNGSTGSGIASYEYRTSTNGGSTFSGPTPLAVGSSVTISSEADTIVQFRATDNVGFTSAWSPSPPIAASTVRLDRTAPTAITISGGSVTFFDAASRTITASGSTGGLSGGVTYKHRTSLNGAGWIEGIGGTVVVTDEGTTMVEFIAVDGALNETLWTSAGADGTVKLDRSAPTVPTLTGATGSTFLPNSASPVTVSALSTDVNGVGGITYQSQVSLNGSAFGDVQAGATRSISAEGVTIVQFRASDSLGHWSAWSSATGSAANTVALDKTAPTVPTIAGGSSFWRDDASIEVSLAASTDSGGSGLSKREYQTTNNGTTSAWITYTAPLNVTAEGDTTIVSRAVDIAGNVSSTDTAHVKLDRLSPTDATVTGGNGSGAPCGTTSIRITGSGASDTVGSGIAFYEYRTSTNGGTNWSGASTGTFVDLTNATTTPITTIVQFRATDFGGHASAWAPFNAGTGSTATLCAV
ncbi:MAG: S-layer domain protein, partial [Thermoleophilia bacterium]|nr:S-layer domain protein [Thermoleophilia bacterium]